MGAMPMQDRWVRCRWSTNRHDVDGVQTGAMLMDYGKPIISYISSEVHWQELTNITLPDGSFELSEDAFPKVRGP